MRSILPRAIKKSWPIDIKCAAFQALVTSAFQNFKRLAPDLHERFLDYEHWKIEQNSFGVEKYTNTSSTI